MKQEKVTFTKEDLIKYCDSLAEKEGDVHMEWNGGNDEGHVTLLAGGETVTGDEADLITTIMHRALDYGSFAGSFYCWGEAKYSTKTKCFKGIDNYEEEDYDDTESNIVISVPKNIWFDSLSYEVDSDDNVNVELLVTNGFKTEEHDEFEKALVLQLGEDFGTHILQTNDKTGVIYQQGYNEETIFRTQFKEEGDFLVYTISQVSLRKTGQEDKSVVVNLKKVDLSVFTKGEYSYYYSY